ncbi:MAG: InlB B-repeat-containing protein [Mollicutes bacterium]|nr:InlB B-repeat-containing protein [Mollicutes bacterium]
MLSILLCLGFTLSSEVHAQGDGPKTFEVNDILPATTQLKISWTSSLIDYTNSINGTYYIQTSSWSKFRIEISNSTSGTGAKIFKVDVNGISTNIFTKDTFPNFISPYTDFGGIHPYIIIDISSLSELDRTITIVENLPLVWEDLNAPTGYSITFEENGGSPVTDLSDQTALPNPLPTPTKSGYTFVNWYYDSAFTQIANPGDTIESDVTLYAKWQINTYTITFEENGGSPVTDLSDQTALPNPLPTPTIENHTFFLGWYYDPDFTNRAFPGDPLTSDVILYAKWGLADTPKVFEVGDVMPLGQVKIQFEHVNDGDFYWINQTITFNNSNKINFNAEEDDGQDIWASVSIEPSLSSNYQIIDDTHAEDEAVYERRNMVCWIIIDFSNCTLEERTVTDISFQGSSGAVLKDITWEDVTPGPKPFEEDDILPAGYIKISWDFTDKFNDIFDYDVTFWIVGDGDPENNLYIEIEVWDYGEEVRFTINQEEFYIDTPGEIVISIPIPYTIVQIDASEGYDYYDSIGDALLWEVVTEEDFIYSEAYQDGYSDGYFLGYKHAREIYGYYDSKTNEWLSVSEYIARYGTDKMGQSDFYNNFDKYFIPAMIIVFGGAIVLTILKVFKGRE